MAATKIFDEKDENSPFLSFIKREFYHGRGTEFRRSLSRKTEVDDLLSDFTIQPPRKRAIIDDIADLERHDLPELFVLKYAKGWSARGVMLLQKMKSGSYFCHLAQETLTFERICEIQNRTAESFSGERSWIVEDMITSTIPGKPIPFDYKFYCFRDEIGMVSQIDRNCDPIKIVLMDDQFTPLRHREDYVMYGRTAQLGTPVVPLHALELLDAARELSCYTDSPFVSVDLYDSPQGPVFGEFTFSPGNVQKRRWVHNRDFLAKLDEKFRAGEEKLARTGSLKPASAAAPGGRAVADKRHFVEEYGILAASVLDGSVHAAKQLSKRCQAYDADDPRQDMLAKSWQKIADLNVQRHKNSVEDRRRFAHRFME